MRLLRVCFGFASGLLRLCFGFASPLLRVSCSSGMSVIMTNLGCRLPGGPLTVYPSEVAGNGIT